jgi:transposase InsO family protein
MYKLNFKKRTWIVKQVLKGVPRVKVALAQEVSNRSVRSIMQTYKEYGWDGLKDHKTGRPETILHRNMEIIILDLRIRYRYGACHIEQILKREGFLISHRQIEKVLIRNGLVKLNFKKQKSRKWVRYELPNPNDLWHTDWTYDPFTGKNFSVYIDDRTRLIVSYGVFNRATAENSIALLKSGIAEYGKPKAVMTDHGAQYYASQANKEQKNTQFRIALNILSIKHVLARVCRPQTNGKVERFFRTYKEEYITQTFTNVNDFVKHYNEKRLHMSLRYKTPKEVWNELKRK